MTLTAQPSNARSGAPVSAAPRHGVRVTRRGRLVLVLALVTIALLAFTLGRSATSQAATEHSSPVPYTATTVQAGETLWAVATRVAPGRDPRVVVSQIEKLNHLSGALQVGQQLLLPHVS